MIIVMDNDEIAEQGIQEELNERRGRYFELWEMQQGNFVVRKEEKRAEVEEKEIENSYENEMSYTEDGLRDCSWC